MAGQTATRVFASEFDHEHVEVFSDRETGLRGVIAVHSTVLGPAMGGLRLRRYDDVEQAAYDALRLSRAMTLKNAAAGLDFGGGKAVLLDDGCWDDRAGRLLAFATRLERLGGRYITAEDVGTTPADMDLLATRTAWVAGRSAGNHGKGDPSPSTARTVFGAISSALSATLGREHLAGVRCAVLGVGKVGADLVRRLSTGGAEIWACDVDATRVSAVAGLPGVHTAAVEEFLGLEVDVLAPCAMGELIGRDDVARLRCSIVAGAANNPLVDDSVAYEIARRGILYVPDFLANAGGIIQVAGEHEGIDELELDRRLGASEQRVDDLLRAALAEGRLPLDVAREFANARLSAARAVPVNGAGHGV